jgi:hypothetical protein
MNYEFDARENVPPVSLGDWRKTKTSSEPLGVIVMPNVAMCNLALSQAQPRTQPHETHKVVMPACQKCNATDEVYLEPYTKSGRFICGRCDEALFYIFDRFPSGCPESGFMPNSLDMLFAKIVLDAFFYVPPVVIESEQ